MVKQSLNVATFSNNLLENLLEKLFVLHYQQISLWQPATQHST